jgi:hypothetical protein
MPIDYSKYPKNWKTEIVPRILLRANNKCEICGLENHAVVHSFQLDIKTIGLNHQTVYKRKTFWIDGLSDMIRFKEFGKIITPKNVTVVLTVAHLDHDSQNHKVSDNRLKAMCQYCHLNYDAKMKWEKQTGG